MKVTGLMRYFPERDSDELHHVASKPRILVQVHKMAQLGKANKR